MKNNHQNNQLKTDMSHQTINDEYLVSVIVPVYNSDKYLVSCLQSIINQTYRNLEIICVDDGSTDKSAEILDFYSKKDDRIKVLKKDNGGPSSARNVGLEKANGEYISFVDSDDVLQLNAYEVLTECAHQSEKWDLIIFGANILNGNDEYLSTKLTTEFKQYIDCKPSNVVFHEKNARPYLWLHFIKRSIIECPTKIRFDESIDLGEDQVFQFSYLPRAKNVMVIDLKLYNYRIQENSSLMQLYTNKRICKTNIHYTIYHKVIDSWKKFGLYECNKDELWTWVIEFIYWTICDLPPEIRKEFSLRLVGDIQNADVEFLIFESERMHFEQIKKWSIDESSDEQRINELKNLIYKEQYEIDETLKSKAFKVGRLFTSSKNRLPI